VPTASSSLAKLSRPRLSGPLLRQRLFELLDAPWRMRSWIERAGYAGPVEVEFFSQDNWWKRPVSDTLAVCAQRLQSVC